MAKKNGQDLGSKVNDHFKVGHYKSLEREKGDEKNVEESEETDEEKEHTDENEDDITQLAQGPKKESGTSDEKDETRRRLCDLGTWLGRVNELTDREKCMALTDLFVPPRHFKFPVRTEYGKERRCQESYLNEFDGVVYSQSLDSLLCKYCILFDNGSSPVQVAKVVSLKKDSPRGLKLATDLVNISKAFAQMR